MAEIEIKLQVPPAAIAAIVEDLRRLGVQRTRMRAAYFDTPDSALARQAMAWRIRREGRRWVQTLKAGQGVVREEHEVIVPGPARVWPTPDLAHHRGSPAGDRLAATLDASPDAAREHFRTDFIRLSARLRTRRGEVELSLDRGQIVAGSLRLPICELEIELLSGSPIAICDVARRLIGRHGLWLDLRSKAQRGHLLARGEAIAQPVSARSVSLTADQSLETAWSRVIDDCATQIIGNASQIAADEGFLPEHVHQLRVGLRRLRTAIRLFDGVGEETLARAGGAGAETTQALDTRAGALARALGSSRDHDVMALVLWPRLAQAGAPLVALPPQSHEIPPRSLLRSREVQEDLMIGLIASQQQAQRRKPTRRRAASAAPSTGAAEGAEPTAASLTAVLRRWQRSAREQAAAFDKLTPEARHRLRRRLKRLRYGIEFARDLLPERRTRALLKSLARAQEALGSANDLGNAIAAYQQAVAKDPSAWFAVGWLSAQRSSVLENCQQSLGRLERIARNWGRAVARRSPTPARHRPAVPDQP